MCRTIPSQVLTPGNDNVFQENAFQDPTPSSLAANELNGLCLLRGKGEGKREGGGGGKDP